MFNDQIIDRETRHDDSQRHHEADQGQRREIRRPALHRPEGQAAARDDGRRRGRGRHVRRRRDVRRLLDRRLEGHQRVRHGADARHRDGPHGPVLRAVDHGHPVRHPRSGLRRALQPRSARHRQEGRSLHEVRRHRRHHLCRPGSRVLRVRRRQVQGRSLQHRLQARLDRTAVQRRHRLRNRQPRPPSARQGRLFPGSADRFGAGHALRNADRARPKWACASRSTTTRWPPPSTSSASSSTRWCATPTRC